MPSRAPAKPKPASTKSASKTSATNTRISKATASQKSGTKTLVSKKSANGTNEVGDWRLDVLNRVRELIQEVEPAMIEEPKWRKPSNGMKGVPVWSHNGIVCTGETYKQAVKLTFANGASIPDPKGLFNSSLEGNTRRAIDIREGDTIDARAFKALIAAAVAQNVLKAKKK